MNNKGYVIASILCAILLIGLGVSKIFCAELPEPQGRVNDIANVLTPDQRNTLERDIRAYEKQTGIEIALVTVPNINGYYSIEEYAEKLFKKWGIGKAGANNGLLIVNAIQERKYRIEVGYGLEGIITDYDAGRIIQNEAIGQLKAGNYYGAYSATIGALKAKLGTMTAEERTVWVEQQKKEAEKRAEELKQGFLTFLLWFAILGIPALGIWVIWWIATKPKREQRRKQEQKEWEKSLREMNEWSAAEAWNKKALEYRGTVTPHGRVLRRAK